MEYIQLKDVYKPNQTTQHQPHRRRPLRYTQQVVYLLVFLAGLWAGVQNALAGGGSFITLPALLLAGLSPLAANITSTVALFPGQLLSGWAGRAQASGAGEAPFWALLLASLLGGGCGAVLLLHTPARLFAQLVPYLILAATLVFIWGNFIRKPGEQTRALGRWPVLLAQFAIAVYGGYFGGGIGILMLAALSMAGLGTRNAGATKNLLAGAINAVAVLMFAFSPQVHWLTALVLGLGAVVGGLVGARMLRRVNEQVLRVVVVVIGLLLTVAMFTKPLS